MDLQIGQKLYRYVSGKNKTPRIIELVVTKIGKKYIYCNENEREPINKSNLTYECKNYFQYNYTLYKTEQEIIDMLYKGQLLEILQKHFNWNGNAGINTLEQLTSITDILGLTPAKTFGIK